MKYLLWFYVYIWNNDPNIIRNYIFIEKDSISFYIKEYKYIKWHINEKITEYFSRSNEKVTGVKCVYLISHNGIKGAIHITYKRADISIFWEDNIENIILLNISKRKLKQLKHEISNNTYNKSIIL